ncbi:MAG: methyltransferase [Candidatus Tectomicrobia bacterium]|uniref:Methyltransferase n=1 Tax=Tectimicrobiota bacterium TaxID=2528274 RepID=A0A932LZE7_UNCTE|nr:methyltransferase [Candidatus Tectomicrobia bacterium]
MEIGGEQGIHLYLFRGLIFLVPDGVQPPKQGSTLLARTVAFRPDDTVLELGTGMGLAALMAARTAGRVIATDISPECTSSTLKNAVLNGLSDKIEVRTGDLYDPVIGLTFDKILANPPQMPVPPSRERGDPQALPDNGGTDGWAILDRIITAAPEYLKPAGCLVFTLFDFLGQEKAFAKLGRAGLNPRLLARELQWFPRLGYERLDHLRAIDEEGTIPQGNQPLHCWRLVIAGAKG